MKETRMPPAQSANLVANSGNTIYGVSVIPQNFEGRKSVKRLRGYGFRKSAAAHPDRDDNTPAARRAEG